MELLQDAVVEVVHGVPQLIRIFHDVVVRDKAGDKLAVEEVVGRVDSARAPVRVIVGIGTRAKRSQGPIGRDFPVIVVLFEAIHVLNIALKMLVFAHLFPLLLRHFFRR